MLTQDQLNQLKSAEPTTSGGNVKANGISADDFFNQTVNGVKPAPAGGDTRAWYDPRRLVDAPVKLASEAGQLIGTGIVKGVEQFQTPEQKALTESRLKAKMDEGIDIPVFGTHVKGITHLSGEEVAGQALGTVGLMTGNPMVAGAALGAGGAMENNSGIVGVGLSGAGGAIGGKIAGIIIPKILEGGFKLAQPVVDDAITKYGRPAYDALASHIPDALKDSYKIMAEKVSSQADRLGNVMQNVSDKTGITKMGEIASNVDKTISGKVSELGQGIKNKAGSTFNIYGMKPEADILKTLPEDVYKLNTKEQKVWYDNAEKNVNNSGMTEFNQNKEQFNADKSNIEASKGISKSQIEQEYTQKYTQLDKDAEDLKRAYSQASANDVEALKPKAQKLVSDKSQEFRDIRAEEIGKKANVKFAKKDVLDFAGKTEGLPTDVEGIQSVINKNVKDGKLSDLEKLSRTLRDKTRSSVYAGNTPMNADEVYYNKTANMIDDYLQSKGIDLSGSKAMWKDWAPMRDDIYKNFQIGQGGKYDTATGSNVLQTRAEGVNVKYDKFLTDLEGQIGEPLDTETKNALSKMKANDLAKAQAKIEEANKIADNDALKQESIKEAQIQKDLKDNKITQSQANKLSNLNSQRISDYRKMWKQRIVKWVIGGGSGVVSIEGLRKLITGSF